MSIIRRAPPVNQLSFWYGIEMDNLQARQWRSRGGCRQTDRGLGRDRDCRYRCSLGPFRPAGERTLLRRRCRGDCCDRFDVRPQVAGSLPSPFGSFVSTALRRLFDARIQIRRQRTVTAGRGPTRSTSATVSPKRLPPVASRIRSQRRTRRFDDRPAKPFACSGDM